MKIILFASYIIKFFNIIMNYHEKTDDNLECE